MIPEGDTQSPGRILPTSLVGFIHLVHIWTRFLLAAVGSILNIFDSDAASLSALFANRQSLKTPSSTFEGIWTEPINSRRLLRREPRPGGVLLHSYSGGVAPNKWKLLLSFGLQPQLDAGESRRRPV